MGFRIVPLLGCACCCFLVLFVIVALALSFKSLDQGYYALKLNWGSQEIDSTVVSKPGMQMIGFGNKLIEYPSTFQNMYFVDSGGGGGVDDVSRRALRARSSDGLEMRVSVSFQWKLEPTSLVPLYDILGGGPKEESLYRDEFVRFARAALLESCSLFEADLFFTNRTIITDDMINRTQAAFKKPDKGLDVQIKGLQLRQVTLPAAFDDEIIKTQAAQQNVAVALAERYQNLTTLQITLTVMQKQALTMVDVARGTAASALDINRAEVNQRLVLAEKNAVSNAKILEQLSNTAASNPFDTLIEIMQISALRSHHPDTLMIDT